MAMTDAEIDFWQKQADAGAKPDHIVAAIKAQRASATTQQQPEQPGMLRQLAQPFIDIGKSALSANDFAARALTSPRETFKNPGAVVREGMRGVNSNIPGGSALASWASGQPEQSAEDQAAAPGAQALGGVLGIPAGGMVGGIAGKAVETAAPMVGRALEAAGKGAQERNIGRTMEAIGEGAGKRNRAGIREGSVENVVRAEPEEFAQAAKDDEKLTAKATRMKERSGGELKKIYASTSGPIDPEGAIANMTKRIEKLDKGTSSDAAVARQLETIRDELRDRLAKRGEVAPADMRAEQSDYQLKGYGKAMPGDDAATARIAANREASKAVGDSVVRHVTGKDYVSAKLEAAAEPDGLAGRLFHHNEQVKAAHKIEAGIADRANKAKPKPEGFAAKALETAREIKHSPTGFAISKIPEAAAHGSIALDTQLAKLIERGRAEKWTGAQLAAAIAKAAPAANVVNDMEGQP